MAGPRKRRRPSERLAEVRQPARGFHDVELRRVITAWKCPCSRNIQPKDTGGAGSTGKPAPLKTNSAIERENQGRPTQLTFACCLFLECFFECDSFSLALWLHLRCGWCAAAGVLWLAFSDRCCLGLFAWGPEESPSFESGPDGSISTGQSRWVDPARPISRLDFLGSASGPADLSATLPDYSS